MTPSTPKTFIHLAREAPGGVVLYRRSHLTTYVLKLTVKDSLRKGSRFYGRLFPERCDLSSDGKLFVYFAMRGKTTDGTSDPATWTAVCEPPWLKALVFCPNGSTWGGGGAFLSRKRLMLFDSAPAQKSVGDHEIVRDGADLKPEDGAYLHMRFARHGETRIPWPGNDRRGRHPELVRRLKKGVASGYDLYDYQLKNPDGSDVAGADEIILANWAGWDFQGRLVVAAGRLIKIYDVTPGKPLYKPSKTLDIEAAIA